MATRGQTGRFRRTRTTTPPIRSSASTWKTPVPGAPTTPCDPRGSRTPSADRTGTRRTSGRAGPASPRAPNPRGHAAYRTPWDRNSAAASASFTPGRIGKPEKHRICGSTDDRPLASPTLVTHRPRYWPVVRELAVGTPGHGADVVGHGHERVERQRVADRPRQGRPRRRSRWPMRRACTAAGRPRREGARPAARPAAAAARPPPSELRIRHTEHGAEGEPPADRLLASARSASRSLRPHRRGQRASRA